MLNLINRINTNNIFFNGNVSCNINFTGKYDHSTAVKAVNLRYQLEEDKFEFSSDNSLSSKIGRKIKITKDEIHRLQTQPKQTRVTESQITTLTKYLKKLERYQKESDINPKTAFFYDPDLTQKEIEQTAKETQGLITLGRLFDETIYPEDEVEKIISNGDIIVHVSSVDNAKVFLDLEFPQNQEALQKLNEKYKNHVTGAEFFSNYNFTQDEFLQGVKNGTLVPAYRRRRYNEAVLDITDPINALAIETHSKIKPVKSKYYASSLKKGTPVSVIYLEKLGHGSASMLAKMVQDGTLKGEIKSFIAKDGKKKYKVGVDLTDKRNQTVLMNLRSKNPKIADAKAFMSSCGIKKDEFNEALLSGEIEIIPEYIFEFDGKTQYINLNIAKNGDYLDRKLAEQEMRAELAQKEKTEKRTYQGAVMKLAWAMSPNTKIVTKKVTSMNPDILKVFEKEQKEGKKALTEDEEKALRIYWKIVWQKAGTQEINGSIQKARKILDMYKNKQYDEISDEYLKIINEYFAAKNQDSEQ